MIASHAQSDAPPVSAPRKQTADERMVTSYLTSMRKIEKESGLPAGSLVQTAREGFGKGNRVRAGCVLAGSIEVGESRVIPPGYMERYAVWLGCPFATKLSKEEPK